MVTAIASDTGLVTPATRPAFSAWGRLCGELSFVALFPALLLRDEAGFLETLFVGRVAVLAAVVRPRALPPLRDLEAVVFAAVLLREEAALLDVLFLDVLFLDVLFLEAAVFFAAVRPPALLPRRDLEAVVFGDLAIHNSLEAGLTWARRVCRLGVSLE